MSTEALEDYWERQRLADERKRARARARKNGDGTPHPLAEAREAKVKGKPCRVCALQGRHNTFDIEGHHIVHRSRLPRHPLLHCQSNILPVCHDHHVDHHSTPRRIPRAALNEDEAAFLLKHAGESWADRWYPTDSGTVKLRSEE